MQFGALQVLLGMGFVYGGVYVLGLPRVAVTEFPVVWAGLGFAFTVVVGFGERYIDDGPGVFLKLGLFAPLALAVVVGAPPALLGAVFGMGVGLVLVGIMWTLVNLR
jgi:hypothetical protein